MMFSNQSTHAATLNVAPGNDENTNNGSCSLTEAIQNINDQAQTNPDCLAGDGNDDTIVLPAGVIYLSFGATPEITAPVNIIGAGVGQAVINGNNAGNRAFKFDGGATISISNLTITNFDNNAIQVSDSNVSIERVEIDGSGAAVTTGTTTLNGIGVYLDGDNQYELTIEDVYIHSLVGGSGGGQGASGLMINNGAGSVLNTNINRVSIEGLSGGGAGGIVVALVLNPFRSGGVTL